MVVFIVELCLHVYNFVFVISVVFCSYPYNSFSSLLSTKNIFEHIF